MSTQYSNLLYRFGAFELSGVTGELRREGIKVKLNAQAVQLLVLLLENPGLLVTREEIQQMLWPGGTFVDFDHGLNSAVNRIREALGDSASNPRFVQTLARRGYRFVAPVERMELGTTDAARLASVVAPVTVKDAPFASIEHTETSLILASPEELPQTDRKTSRTLFVLLQFMYLGFYVGALVNQAEIDDLLENMLVLPHSVFFVIVVSACIMVPVRLFLLAAATFQPPGLMTKFKKLFPVLLIMDILWALSPFLLMHHINWGLALAATAALVYSPFAQRSLVLMSFAAVPERN